MSGLLAFVLLVTGMGVGTLICGLVPLSLPLSHRMMRILEVFGAGLLVAQLSRSSSQKAPTRSLRMSRRLHHSLQSVQVRMHHCLQPACNPPTTLLAHLLLSTNTRASLGRGPLSQNETSHPPATTITITTTTTTKTATMRTKTRSPQPMQDIAWARASSLVSCSCMSLTSSPRAPAAPRKHTTARHIHTEGITTTTTPLPHNDRVSRHIDSPSRSITRPRAAAAAAHARCTR